MLVVTLREALLPVLAGLLLAAFPGLLADREARPRPLAAAALWICALAVLLTNAAVFAVGDDEVFYLADSWAARNGETGGMLPMRYLVFRPFLAPGLGPGAAVIAGRAATCAMALLAGGLVWHAARRLSAGPYAALAGAVAVLWLVTSAEMVFLRPEYFACLFLLLGLTCLVAPPRRFSPPMSVVAGLAMLTLAAATSHRHAVFPLVGLIVALRQRETVPARRTLAWAGIGVLAGAAPSLAYVALRDSPQSLWYWNWTFVVHHSWVRTDELSGRFPVFLFFLGLAGCVAALWWRNDQVEVRSVGIFWACATLFTVLVPFGGPYAMGPWLAISALLGAILAGRLLPGVASPAARRGLGLALGLVAATPLLGPVGLRVVHPPFSLFEQTRLLDWLRETSGGGPVACVAPYHPIKARNAWRLWNAWWYCYLRDPAFNASLSPRLGHMLRAGEARIIGWDPWPEASGHRNVLAYAVANGLVAADEVEAVSRSLEANYRLVRWNRPGPPRFGGSRFLVHRAIALDDRVTVLSGHRIGP